MRGYIPSTSPGADPCLPHTALQHWGRARPRCLLQATKPQETSGFNHTNGAQRPETLPNPTAYSLAKPWFCVPSSLARAPHAEWPRWPPPAMGHGRGPARLLQLFGSRTSAGQLSQAAGPGGCLGDLGGLCPNAVSLPASPGVPRCSLPPPFVPQKIRFGSSCWRNACGDLWGPAAPRFPECPHKIEAPHGCPCPPEHEGRWGGSAKLRGLRRGAMPCGPPVP